MTSSVSDNNTTTQPAESEQMEVLESYQFPTKHTVPQDKLALLGKAIHSMSFLLMFTLNNNLRITKLSNFNETESYRSEIYFGMNIFFF